MSRSRYTKHVSKSHRPWRSRTTIAPCCTHRHVVLGATYFVTKKCDRDEFLIRPTPEIDAILLYLLGLKAFRYRLLIHGYVFVSNHRQWE